MPALWSNSGNLFSAFDANLIDSCFVAAGIGGAVPAREMLPKLHLAPKRHYAVSFSAQHRLGMTARERELNIRDTSPRQGRVSLTTRNASDVRALEPEVDVFFANAAVTGATTDPFRVVAVAVRHGHFLLALLDELGQD